MGLKKRYSDVLNEPGDFFQFEGRISKLQYEERVTVTLRRDDVLALLLGVASSGYSQSHFGGSEFDMEQAEDAFDMLTSATEEHGDGEA